MVHFNIFVGSELAKTSSAPPKSHFLSPAQISIFHLMAIGILSLLFPLLTQSRRGLRRTTKLCFPTRTVDHEGEHPTPRIRSLIVRRESIQFLISTSRLPPASKLITILGPNSCPELESKNAHPFAILVTVDARTLAYDLYTQAGWPSGIV